MKKFARTAVTTLALVVALGLGAGTDVEAAKKNSVKKIAVEAEGISGKKLTIAKGKSKQLTVKVNGKAVKKNQISKKVTIKAKNSKIVKVTKTGKLTGKKAGKTTVTIKSKVNPKKKVTLTVTVKKDAVKSIKATPKKMTVKIGKTAKIKYTVKTTGKKASKAVSFTSSNKKVATVTSKGVIKGVRAGKATITIKALDGSGKKATVNVTVAAWKTVLTPKNADSVTVKVEFSDAAKLQADVDALAKLAKLNKGDDVQLTLDGKKYVATFDGTNVLINGKKFADSEAAKNAKSATVQVAVKADKIASAIAFAPASVTKITVDKVEFTEITAKTFKMNGKKYTYTVDGKNIVVNGKVKADFSALSNYVTITVK